MTIRALQVLLCLSVNCALTAQDKAPGEEASQEKAAIMTPTKIQINAKDLRKPQTTAKDSTSNLSSLTVYDAFSNIVVAAGQNLTLTSVADWTGADHVSVAIECPTSTSLQNTGIAVEWGVPLSNAPNYTATDLIYGKNLLLPNMGGAVVPAYGTMLQLLIVNSGTTSIACDQVTVYGIVH